MPREGGYGGNNNLRRLDTETAREIGRKGGAAKGRKIRQQKNMQELFKACLRLKIKDVPGLKKAAKALGLDECDNLEAFLTLSTMVNTAKKDDITVLDTVMRYKGENLGSTAKDTAQESAHAELMRAVLGNSSDAERDDASDED